MTESTEYLLGNSADERERLLRQGELFREQAIWLLDHFVLARRRAVEQFSAASLVPKYLAMYERMAAGG